MPRPMTLCGGTRSRLSPSNSDVAAVRRVEARDEVEDRRLARAVGADQADDLPLRHVERDVVDRDDAAEAAREVTRFEQRHGASLRRRWCGVYRADVGSEVFGDLKLLGRYAARPATACRAPVLDADCHELLRQGMANREQSFLRLLETVILAQPENPYRALLEHAGVEIGDVAALVETHGLEGALDVLYDAGVYVTHDEYRGRVPVRRGSLELAFDVDATVNVSRSPGARRAKRRVARAGSEKPPEPRGADARRRIRRPVPLRLRPERAACARLVSGAADPSGIGNVLALTKAGTTPERWFYPTAIGEQPESAKARALIAVTVASGRLGGARFPYPRHLPPERAHEIAEWAGRKVAAGTPPLIAANPSASARISAAAAERGIDLSGTFFRMGGEPFTPAKQALLASVGATGACFFYNGEVGGLSGVPCADPAAVGDVHLCSHRLALSTRDVELRDGSTVPALCLTTIHHTVRATAINLVTDDFAVVEERECECELGTLGLRTHLHSIRSFEKLTGEGVSFLGEPLIELVERVLPARYGGALTDYQFVERETDGITRLALRASSRVGPLDASAVVETVLAHLEPRTARAQVMASLWRAAGTIDGRTRGAGADEEREGAAARVRARGYRAAGSVTGAWQAKRSQT